MGSYSRRNLLICFDAFGTLFKPRRPVAQQYAEVASSLASRKFTEAEVENPFIKAFKQESKDHPNYGKATGMSPETWWSNIIINTFKPLMPPNEKVPDELAPKLIHRFMSKEGYELQPGASEALRHIRDTPRKNFDKIVVGIITNSDPRVPDVLSSLGLRINSLRYCASNPTEVTSEHDWDIDFSVMSYDVGREKPDTKIFKAAVEMLGLALQSRGDTTTSSKDWAKVYIGDEYGKDVVGAEKAGWNSVLISEEAMCDHEGNQLVKWLEDEPVSESSSLMQVFESGSSAVGFRSLYRTCDWLRL